jgi:hypothetical protein
MPRSHNLPKLQPVAAYEVAPHRYLYNRPFDPSVDMPETYKETIAAAPYKVGDVVLTVCGEGYARAYVAGVYADRNHYGELREYYLIRRETKAGEWSKRPYHAWPGQIQRGYQRAGQAPEMPKDAPQ